MDYDAHKLEKCYIYKYFGEKKPHWDGKQTPVLKRGLFNRPKSKPEGLKDRNRSACRIIQVSILDFLNVCK